MSDNVVLTNEAKQIAIYDLTTALGVGALRHNIAQRFFVN